jgi:hypothetical protein
MKVEDCIVSVERRSVGGCIDLAFVFARQFFLPLSWLTLCFAVPSTLLAWLLGESMGRDVLIPCTVIFAFFSTMLGGAMIATVGPQVFGVPMNTMSALRGLGSRFVPFALLAILARSTGLCMVIPVVFVLAWCGHLPEVMFLERTPLSQISQRLSWLGRGGGYSRNFGRLLTLTCFWVLFAAGLFLMIDLISGWVFNSPIFFGTIAPSPDLLKAMTSRIIDDPLVVVTLHVAMWMTYPIIRLAWFFCYLDQRIRNECWDLDLQFRVEAVRLQEQMA